MGKILDKIASKFNIGTGSVSNIIEQWQNRIGVFDAINLRELGIALKTAGISPVQYVDGVKNSFLPELSLLHSLIKFPCTENF